jgi:hypothetical protein
VLAKTVTTPDVLWGDRAELEIGAAWYELAVEEDRGEVVVRTEGRLQPVRGAPGSISSWTRCLSHECP